VADYRSLVYDIALPDPTTGRTVQRQDFAGKPLLVVFMCNHCPYVIHLADAVADLVAEYQDEGLAMVGINANDVEAHPDDSPEKMIDEARNRRYTFPYLYDETQEVAKAYSAACTPDFFLFDKDHRLYYRGQFDDTRPKQDPPQKPTGDDLRQAIQAVLKGEPAPQPQRPSLGCNIKWKPGNEPRYFNG
ncbi:MAG: thioredoxin family protein, partial [Phycisphaeraceae bacterium]